MGKPLSFNCKVLESAERIISEIDKLLEYEDNSDYFRGSNFEKYEGIVRKCKGVMRAIIHDMDGGDDWSSVE